MREAEHRAFWAAVAQRPVDAAIDALLDDALAHARATWPDVTLPADVYFAYLAARIDGPELAAGLAALRLDELYLACACVHGDPSALGAFERSYLGELDGLFRRFRGSDLRDDALQQLREKLFVTRDEIPPKLATFDGRGALHTWVRVTASRLLINLVTRAPKDAPNAEGDVFDALAASGDLEVDYLQRKYRPIIRASFDAAIVALDARDRALLRRSLLEGATIDDLARDHAVHRATAARWLLAAREHLLAGMRTELRTRLSIEDAELDSLLRLFGSQLDLSLGGLREPAE